MGMNQQDSNASQDHSNTTTYLGSNAIFAPLLQELGRSYGTQRSMADLILGGKQYGEARRFMPDEYRDLDRDQARSVASANQRNRKTKPMPTYKDSEGNYWMWDPQKEIYQAHESEASTDKDGKPTIRLTGKIKGAWSPYDPNNKTPPWKAVAPGGGPTPGDAGSIGGGGSPDPKGGSGSGGLGGSGSGAGGYGTPGAPPVVVNSGSGGAPPQTPSGTPRPTPTPQTPSGTPRPTPRRVPGVGSDTETGLTGVRTESPTTTSGVTLGDRDSMGGDSAAPSWDSRLRSEFETNFGMTPTGMDVTYDRQPGASSRNRDSWRTNYDPRPSSETFADLLRRG